MTLLKKWCWRLLIGLVLLLSALLITAPAQLLENQLTSRIPNLQVSGTQGSFWSGSFDQIRYRGIRIQQLSWRLSASALLTAGFGADITLEDPLFDGNFSLKQSVSGSTSISHINAVQSIVALSTQLPLLQFLQPQGTLVWEDVSLQLQQQRWIQASGIIHWDNAALTISREQFLLGKISLQPKTENNHLILHITSDPLIDLKGTLRISPNGQYHLSLSMTEQLPEKMFQAVRLLARPDGNGRLLFDFSGQW